MKYMIISLCPNEGKKEGMENLLKCLVDGYEIYNTSHNRDMIVYILRKNK